MAGLLDGKKQWRDTFHIGKACACPAIAVGGLGSLARSNGGTRSTLPRLVHVPPLLLAAWVHGIFPAIGVGGTLASQPRHHPSRQW